MQAARSNRVRLGENLNSVEDATGVDAVDFSADIDNLIGKFILTDLYDTGKVDADVLRYIPGMSKIMYQGQLDHIETKKCYVESTYTNKEMMEFNINITANHYVNFSNMVLCLPVTFRKTATNTAAIERDLIPVNNFFAHWIKDVIVRRYGDDVAVLPINTVLEVYRYSEAMLKHLPDDVLATFQNQLLYSKKKKKRVIIKGNAANSFNDRRNHIAVSARNSNTDDNLENRISKSNDDDALSKTTVVYRIPLKYLVDLGLVNLPTEFDVKFIFNLEKNGSKLFESRTKIANLTAGAAAPLPTDAPDADVHFFGAPYLQYEQIKLSDTFDKYVSKALRLKRVLRTGIKPTPFKKTFEINTGSQSHIVDFKGANKQFSFVEISFVYDKSEQTSWRI